MIFRSTDRAASAAEASSVSERTKSSLSLPRALFTAVCGVAYAPSLSLSSPADPHAAKKVAKHRREINKGQKNNGMRIFIFRWYYKMIVRASLAVKGHSPENLASPVAVSCALSHAILSIKGDRELETRRSHEENAYFGRMLKAGCGNYGTDRFRSRRHGFPGLSCLAWVRKKTEPPTAFRPEPVRLLSCQLRLALQCGKVLATGRVKWYF